MFSTLSEGLQKLFRLVRKGQAMERPEVDLTPHELIAAQLFFVEGEETEGVELVVGPFEENGEQFGGYASCTETGSVFLAGYLACVRSFQEHYDEHVDQSTGAVPVRRAA